MLSTEPLHYFGHLYLAKRLFLLNFSFGQNFSSLYLYFGVMRSMMITDVPQTISIDFEKQPNWGHFLFYGLFWPNFYVALKGKSKRRPANIIKNVFSCKAKVKIWKCILCTFCQSHFRVYFFSLRDPLMESLALHWLWIVKSCHEMFRPKIGILHLHFGLRCILS